MSDLFRSLQLIDPIVTMGTGNIAQSNSYSVLNSASPFLAKEMEKFPPSRGPFCSLHRMQLSCKLGSRTVQLHLLPLPLFPSRLAVLISLPIGWINLPVSNLMTLVVHHLTGWKISQSISPRLAGQGGAPDIGC